MSRAAFLTTTKMAIVMASPMIGSASFQPSDTPIAPSTTARLVKPSVRAW